MAGSVVLFRSSSSSSSSSQMGFVLFLLICSSSTIGVVNGLGRRGRMVGSRMEIKDVKTNREVEELGRFSVSEFNLKQRKEQGREGAITFWEVVEAQRQVVSGVKYYLKISASDNGVPKMFDAVVVIKPWVRSKELLTFAPSTNLQRSF